MLNFTVGPVMSDQEVLEVASFSTPYFRTSEFSNIMFENENMMLQLLNAPKDSRCVFLTSSGTGAMEACVMNVLNDMDKVLVINGGSFGERFVELCRFHNRDFTEIKLSFGEQIKEAHLENYHQKGYSAFLVNMHETSSGTLYNMDLIAEFCKKNHITLIVDAISSFIADELDMKKLGAAVVITGSQKALAVQPGIAIVAMSPDALARVNQNKEKCYYFSLKEALKNGERGQTPFTPAVTVLLQINKRLRKICEHGIEVERNKIVKNAKDFRDRIIDFPFELVSENMSNAVTTLRHKSGNGAKEIVRILKDEYQIWVCPNGGEKADEVFRVGHIGCIQEEDNEKLIQALTDMKERNLL